MKISKSEVEYIAHLARLELSNEEKEKFTVQLTAILEYMDKLNELDTANVPPTTHVINIVNAWREDICKKYENPDLIIDNAPEKESLTGSVVGKFFKVKKIIV